MYINTSRVEQAIFVQLLVFLVPPIWQMNFSQTAQGLTLANLQPANLLTSGQQHTRHCNAPARDHLRRRMIASTNTRPADRKRGDP